jgi:hypothetical protein
MWHRALGTEVATDLTDQEVRAPNLPNLLAPSGPCRAPALLRVVDLSVSSKPVLSYRVVEALRLLLHLKRASDW